MNKTITTVALAALTATAALAQSLPVYLDATKPIEQRVEDALKRMTLDEKIAVIAASVGYTNMNYFYQQFNQYYHTTPSEMRIRGSERN